MKKILLALALFFFPMPAWAIPPYVTTATIASGASMSSLVSIAPFSNVGPPQSVQIIIPSTWTTANLTFFVCSSTGTGCVELYDGAGNEYTVVVTAVSTIILLDPNVFSYVSYFKIQSGTTGSPVNQVAARTLMINLY